MTTATLLPCLDGIQVESVTSESDTIVVRLSTVAPQRACPLCGVRTSRVHSRYARTLTDLPWNGVTIRIHLRTRKFFCDNPACERQVFTEPLPDLAARYARKTNRLADFLLHLTYLAGGETTQQIAQRLGLLVTPAGLIKHIKKQTPRSTVATPRVLGIDDFAFLKGYRYGTLLIDLETGKPIDLLPDREPASVEAWLRAHPGIEVISRDRSMGYAGAIRQAAPQAKVVADRFHIMKNLMEALEKQVAKEYPAIRQQLSPTSKPATVPDPSVHEPSLTTWQGRRQKQSRQRRLAGWEQVHQLAKEGHTQQEIADKVGMALPTLRRYLRASTFPERRPHACPGGKLDAYQDYLLRRWQEGCQNALQLWRELKQQGFTGGASIVRNYVRPWREGDGTPTIVEARRCIPSVRALSWLLLPRKKRSESQTQMRQQLLEAFPSLAQSQQLVEQFRSLLRAGSLVDFQSWLQEAKNSELTDIATFARGLEQDRAAIEAAITEKWSNGPTEGHVNRLKCIKRQGYGRASFELLKARVLPLAA